MKTCKTCGKTKPLLELSKEEKKLKANAARAAGVKDYWDAVRVVMKVNKITNVKEGRSKLTEDGWQFYC